MKINNLSLFLMAISLIASLISFILQLFVINKAIMFFINYIGIIVSGVIFIKIQNSYIFSHRKSNQQVLKEFKAYYISDKNKEIFLCKALINYSQYVEKIDNVYIEQKMERFYLFHNYRYGGFWGKEGSGMTVRIRFLDDIIQSYNSDNIV